MRFGVMINGLMVQRWQAESIQLLLDAGHRCELLIVDGTEYPKKSLIQKAHTYIGKHLLINILSRFLIRPKAKVLVPLPHGLEAVHKIYCKPVKKGYAQYFSHLEIDAIKSHTLDFILRYGFSIIKGEILESSRYGIWSFHHDDEKKYRGVPTGFWEIWYNDPVNAMILQKLTDRVDGGVILKKGYLQTISHSWEANLNNLLMAGTEWPLQVCRDIENGSTLALKTQGDKPDNPLRHLPGNLLTIAFLFKLLVNKFRFHQADLFFAEKWTPGIINCPVEMLAGRCDYTINWLPEEKQGRYLADPFGYPEDGLLRLVTESYDYKSRKGEIVSLVCQPDGKIIRYPETVITNGVHLAFPYLFEYEGSRYCIPETSLKNRVELYQVHTDGTLELHKILIEGLQAVDPTLVQFNDIWWLFFTDTVSTNERLHIWYSENLTGEYKPHANNPVKTDVRSSRPAGKPFLLDGQLIRPAQDCSIHYGSRIVFNRITELTLSRFSEETVSYLQPTPGSRYNKGMHTISSAGDFTIIDGKRHVFIYRSFIHKLIQKTSKLFRIK